MDASPADIRRFLVDYFNDEDLSSLCFDYFHEVYNDFAAGMPTGRKARELVDYCRRRDRLPELLAALQRERPEAYGRVFGGHRVNLNTAAPEDLRGLPGIGPALARAIVDHRPYHAVEDLLCVPRIGSRRLAALRERCVV